MGRKKKRLPVAASAVPQTKNHESTPTSSSTGNDMVTNNHDEDVMTSTEQPMEVKQPQKPSSCSRSKRRRRKIKKRQKKSGQSCFIEERAETLKNEYGFSIDCKDDYDSTSEKDNAGALDIRDGGGDCFDEIHGKRKGMVCDGSVRMSWLNDTGWIGKRCVEEMECERSYSTSRSRHPLMEPMDERHGNESPSRRRVRPRRDIHDTNDLPNRNISENEDDATRHLSVSSQLPFLQMKLGQIKHRLWPAAVECSANRNSNPTAQKRNQLTPGDAFENARRIANPFEELGEGRRGGLNKTFVNRSAVKLANLDAMFGFSLTTGTPPRPSVRSRDGAASRSTTAMGSFQFADLCGAPGGFSEYILHRCHTDDRNLRVRGWGMSLIGANERGTGTPWKLEHLATLDGGANAHYRVCTGVDGTGDICNWENVEALRREILEDSITVPGGGVCVGDESAVLSGGGLVDLVVADGGFDAQRNKENQEQITNDIVVCQIAAGLSLLKEGGKFVLKVFGTRSKIGKSFVKLLYNMFHKIVIVKPILSRPASAERYIICYGYTGPSDGWEPLTWRNQIRNRCCDDPMDTKNIFSPEDEDNDHFANDFAIENYVNCIDRDILILNIKTCFAILSHLERKTPNNCQTNIIQEGSCKPVENHPKKRNVDIFMYKKAWKID